MKPPRIHPLLADIVNTAVSAVDGIIFCEHASCPACGGPLIGYDTKRKQFAHLITENGPRTVYIDIRRFYCRDCHRFCLADNPIYPDTRIGSIIIDLCIALSMTLPVNRVPVYLAAMGILVNRTSCRLYIQNNCRYFVRNNVRYIETNDIFGIHLPLSVLSLSTLVTDSGEGSQIKASDFLAACGFPSSQQTPVNRLFQLKQLKRRYDPGY
ncbi:MAG: hypothetical protein M0Q92_01655 [Methanoregula sp.]|jgi:hypothetical protein|nr:hypothetical protein [Methanoregula sp.]